MGNVDKTSQHTHQMRGNRVSGRTRTNPRCDKIRFTDVSHIHLQCFFRVAFTRLIYRMYLPVSAHLLTSSNAAWTVTAAMGRHTRSGGVKRSPERGVVAPVICYR
jgi:hypothetical protein